MPAMDAPTESLPTRLASLRSIARRCARWGTTAHCLFYQPGCPACHQMLPRWHGASLRDDSALWLHVRDPEALQAFGITRVPTAITFGAHGATPADAATLVDKRGMPTTGAAAAGAPQADVLRSRFAERADAVDAAVRAGARAVVLSADAAAYDRLRHAWNRAMLRDSDQRWQWWVAKTAGAPSLRVHEDGTSRTLPLPTTADQLADALGLGASPTALSTLLPRARRADVLRTASEEVPVMVLYHADWCGHCASFKPKWNEVVTETADAGNALWLAVNDGDDDAAELMRGDEVDGFPTVMRHFRGSRINMADSEPRRDAEALRRFALGA